MQVACVQLSYPDDESKEERRDRVLNLVEGLTADLVVLPELWPTGYFAFDRYAAEAESMEGETVTGLRRIAARCGITLMGGTFVERHADGLANCAVTIGPDGSILHTYRKIHLFGYQSEEARLLTPGTDLTVAETAFAPVGTSTCYDLRFPELYRKLVDQGAQMVIIPAAWPLARLEHWRLLLRARAIENQVFVIACNGAGTQHGTELAGHSVIIDPWGNVVAEAGSEAESLTATIDLANVTRIRAEFPVLEHRRLGVEHRPERSQPP